MTPRPAPFALFLGLAACAPTGVVAIVDDVVLDPADYAAHVAAHPEGNAATVDEILQAMVDETLAANQSRAMGLDREPGMREQLRAFERDLLATEYVRSNFAKELVVTREELASHWEAEQTELHLRHVLTGSQEESLAVREQLDAGADFAEVARTRSSDEATVVRGGDLGWRKVTSLDPSFLRHVATLKPGEITAPFQTPIGWHVVECQGRRVPPMPEGDALSALELAIQRKRAAQLKARAAALLREQLPTRKYAERLEGDYDLIVTAANQDVVVAEVGSVPITMADLKHDMGLIFRSRGQSHVMGPVAKGEFLNLLAETVTLELGAIAQGLRDAPAIRARIDHQQRHDLAQRFRARAREDLKPTADEVRSWYDSHPEELEPGDEVHLWFLVAATREEASAALEEITRTQDLPEVARTRSTDPTAQENGGDAGWVPLAALADQLGEDVGALLARANPSRPIGPVETPFGWQLLSVLDRRPAPYPDLDTDAEHITAMYLHTFSDDLWRRKVDELRSRASVRIYARNVTRDATPGGPTRAPILGPAEAATHPE